MKSRKFRLAARKQETGELAYNKNLLPPKGLSLRRPQTACLSNEEGMLCEQHFFCTVLRLSIAVFTTASCLGENREHDSAQHPVQ